MLNIPLGRMIHVVHVWPYGELSEQLMCASIKFFSISFPITLGPGWEKTRVKKFRIPGKEKRGRTN